jgi:hypothetical protein
VRTAAAVTGPFIAIGLLLAGYNYARFGSITQTGESYDVGCNCVHAPQFSPSALPEGAFLYLVAPARFSLAFPYFTLPPPPRYPGTILGWSPQEPDGGLLALAPITLDLVALPLLLRRRRSKDNRELGVVSALLVIAGGAIAFGVSSVGAVNVRFTIRLEADFATVLMLPALAIWLAIGSGGWRRKTLSVVGSVLIVFGSIVGVAISMVGYYNALYTESQHTYLNLQSATSVFPTLATKILGHPVITAVASPAGVTANIFNYTTLGVGDSLSFYLSRAASEIDVTSPDSATYDLRASFVRGSDAAPKGRILIATQNGTHAAQQRFVPGIRNLTLHLSEGLNRIHITARPAIGVTSKPGAKEVEIYSISLVRK